MSNIDALARDWLESKSDEQKATTRRLAIEKEITAALEAKDEGSITHKLDEYKVTLTQPVTRKVDEKMWAGVKHKIPEQLRPVKTKLEADASGMKWLAENEPKFWAAVAPAFTTKAGKISVKVEKLEKA